MKRSTLIYQVSMELVKLATTVGGNLSLLKDMKSRESSNVTFVGDAERKDILRRTTRYKVLLINRYKRRLLLLLEGSAKERKEVAKILCFMLR